MLAVGNEKRLYLFQFAVKVQRRQGRSRVRALLEASEVIIDIKRHEGVTWTFRALGLTSCGLMGVSDARLGGVDHFGYPADQDSKTAKVYSQPEEDSSSGRTHSRLWVPGASSTSLDVMLELSHKCVRPGMAANT